MPPGSSPSSRAMAPDEQGVGQPTAEAVHRRKRLKIDVACETCRQKKVRCDGARPVCGYCSRKLSLRDTCHYSSNEGSSKPQRSSSDQPIRPLTNARTPGTYGRKPETPILAKPPVQSLAASYVHGSNGSPAAGEVALSTPGSNTHVSLAGSRTSANGISPSAIDSMTTAIDEGTTTREVFGSSSAGSFTSQIKKAIDVRQGRRSNAAHYPDRSVSGSGASLAYSPPDVSYVLPPRRQADHLMGQYWFYVDPLYPFLDRARWERSYEAIFAGTRLDVDERLFVATLNIVLALSTQLVETMSHDTREETSNRYLQRAQELQPVHLPGPVSLELVQYLLLTSQFLQSTDQPHHTWMAVGSAIRTAQSLGLHLEETSSGREDAVERELIRRVWYGCVLMDRMVSVTHGRPTMISHHLARFITEPSASAYPRSGMSSDSVDRVTFFVKSVRLYEIMYRIINDLYGSVNGLQKGKRDSPDSDDPDAETDEALDSVVRLDRCLSRWESRLPAHLKWEKLSSNKDEIHRRQTVILRMRYMHARMLLLRPVLSRFCLASSPAEATSPTTSLQARLLEQGAQLCVTNAQETIADVVQHQRHDGKIGLLPAWWYRVYYVYTAATILVAARLRPEAFPIAGLARSWTQAMSIMKAHEGFRDSVQRCVAALHVLSSKVLQSAPDGQGLSRPASPRPAGNEGNLTHLSTSMPPRGDVDMQLPSESINVSTAEMFQDFAPPTADLGGLEPADFNFDVNDMAWLHDMQGAWELLNE